MVRTEEVEFVTTPVRSLVEPDSAGVSRLSQPEVDYLDGSEDEIFEIVSSASDRSSLSEELRNHIRDWATEYHLSPIRGNVVRSLGLTQDMTVLEIGSGCGAVGRTIAELSGRADLVEPVYARARAAAARVADLPGARVFQGDIGDVPAKATYDAIICIGVLEYVGNGSNADEPYIEFLRACQERLKPGGTLVVAIENTLGAKYIAGSAEDHTQRPFDSLEGYLLPSPARTFTRARLSGFARAAGLEPQVLSILPDYKLPSAVLSPALYERLPRLAADIHRTPARDYLHKGVQGADERRLWALLVEAGVGVDFSNSFLMLASKGGPSSLWDPTVLASRFTSERRRQFVTRTEFRLEDGKAVTVRELLEPQADADTWLRWTPTEDPVVSGPMLSDRILDAADPLPLLEQWVDVVRQSDPGAMDMQPWNMIVTDNGLQVIDQEWMIQGFTHDDVIRRGLVLLALDLGHTRRFEGEAGQETPRQLVERWAGHLGIDVSPATIDAAIDLEARIATTVRPVSEVDIAHVVRSSLDTPLHRLRPLRVDAQLSLVTQQRDLMAQDLANPRVYAVAQKERVRASGAPLTARLKVGVRYNPVVDAIMRRPAVRKWLEGRRGA